MLTDVIDDKLLGTVTAGHRIAVWVSVLREGCKTTWQSQLSLEGALAEARGCLDRAYGRQGEIAIECKDDDKRTAIERQKRAQEHVDHHRSRVEAIESDLNTLLKTSWRQLDDIRRELYGFLASHAPWVSTKLQELPRSFCSGWIDRVSRNSCDRMIWDPFYEELGHIDVALAADPPPDGDLGEWSVVLQMKQIGSVLGLRSAARRRAVEPRLEGIGSVLVEVKRESYRVRLDTMDARYREKFREIEG